jgi:hypothetical protein
LGKTIQELAPELRRLHNKYGFHVCGEGGEYESLTLDCPLFVKRIVLDEVQLIVTSDDPYSPVAFLHISKFHLEPKAELSAIRIQHEQIAQITLPNPVIANPVNSSCDAHQLLPFVKAQTNQTGEFICASAYVAFPTSIENQAWFIFNYLAGMRVILVSCECVSD